MATNRNAPATGGTIARVSEAASAAADRAAEARRAIGPVSVKLAEAKRPALNSRQLAERDYARLALADRAREIAMLERDVRRAEAARRRNAEATKRAALAMPVEQLAKWGRAAGEASAAAELEAMASAADAMGISAAELAAELAAERAMLAEAMPAPKRVTEAGQTSFLSAAERAEVAKWTSEALASEAARAGRAALDAIGPRAAAVVVTGRAAERLTLAKVVTAASAERAAARAAKLAERLAEARAKLAEAETKVRAAEATKAVRPIREANREADRVAASVAKLASKHAEAAKLAEASGAGQELKDANGLIAVPVATLELAEAASAAALELPARKDAMPVGYVHSGPVARHIVRPVRDSTGDSAAALADGYRAAMLAAELAEAKRAAKLAAAKRPATGRPKQSEAERAEYKARRAAAARGRRRAAKLRNK